MTRFEETVEFLDDPKLKKLLLEGDFLHDLTPDGRYVLEGLVVLVLNAVEKVKVLRVGQSGVAIKRSGQLRRKSKAIEQALAEINVTVPRTDIDDTDWGL